MLKTALCLTVLVQLLLVKICAACSCRYQHPQDLICRSKFVGIIRITAEGMKTKVKSDDPRRMIAAYVTISKVLKGKYEDFDEDSQVYLYTPAMAFSCRRKFKPGSFLVTGRPHRGGLHVNFCDLAIVEDDLNETQLLAIKSHIRSRAYIKGCSECVVKRPSDYKSYVYRYQCPPKYEFPISTSACLPTGPRGQCEWREKSIRKFKQPPQVSGSAEPTVPTSTEANSQRPSFASSVLKMRDAEVVVASKKPPVERIESRENQQSNTDNTSLSTHKGGEEVTVATAPQYSSTEKTTKSPNSSASPVAINGLPKSTTTSSGTTTAISPKTTAISSETTTTTSPKATTTSPTSATRRVIRVKWPVWPLFFER